MAESDGIPYDYQHLNRNKTKGETASEILHSLGANAQEQLEEECKKFYLWRHYYEQYEKAQHKE